MALLHELTASALASLVRRREVSCREVVEAHLARIDATNSETNAVTVVLRDTALALADGYDTSADGDDLPLRGVPFTVKENLDCLGSATTHGIPQLRAAMPYADAPIVERMKRSGAIPIARTNLSELGMRLCTFNPLHGRTQNPRSRRLSVGGSSGGDAAAVATGMAPIGLGNDIGGSLRIPAAFCGVVALKPTAGRVAHASSLEPRDYGIAGQSMLVHGPLARCVADTRLALSVVAGRDIRDPRSVDVALEGPRTERKAALVLELPGAPLPPHVVASIRRAGALLEAAGWEVEEAAPPEISRVNQLWVRLLAEDFAVMVERLRPYLTEALVDHMTRMFRTRRRPPMTSYALHSERSRLGRAWSGFFSEYPVAIGPCAARDIWPPDADLDPDHGLDLLEETVRFVTPASFLGLPALAVPVVTPAARGEAAIFGTGVQVCADSFREDLCFEAATIIEAGVGAAAPIDPRP